MADGWDKTNPKKAIDVLTALTVIKVRFPASLKVEVHGSRHSFVR